jgi:transposase
MSYKHSKLSSKTLHSQTREVVWNVYKLMKSEAESGKPILDFRKVQERVAKATGISQSSVRRIVKEGKLLFSPEVAAGTSFSTPGKKHRVSKPITGVDDFDKSVIRRTVRNFYIEEKCVPTVKKVLEKLKETINFKGGSTSLKIILKEIGFRWVRTKDNRSILTETHEIRAMRIHYLLNIKQFREEGRTIVYQDETYIHSSHTLPYTWHDQVQPGGYAAPVAKGQRLIIVHAGSQYGFVPNALLIFKSNQKTGDYHDNMNADNYRRWVEEKLVPNLPANSVLVIDNASYHNVQLDKPPISNSTKSDMQTWLTRHAITFRPDMVKAELYEIIKLHKPKFKTYLIDQILQSKGHLVLRLPPYHPELNPIEMIWSEIKRYVAEKNITFNLNNTKQLCEEKISAMTASDWDKRCTHVVKIEKEYLEKEAVVDEAIDRFIIHIGQESSSDSSVNDFVEEDNSLSGIEELPDTD